MKVLFETDASEVVAFAAEELTRYLKQMVEDLDNIDLDNIDLEIKLRSDSSMFPADSNDSYRVHIEQEHGTIAGNNDRSVLLAVYDYLQTLGCRFLMPVKICEIIPHIWRYR